MLFDLEVPCVRGPHTKFKENNLNLNFWLHINNNLKRKIGRHISK